MLEYYIATEVKKYKPFLLMTALVGGIIGVTTEIVYDLALYANLILVVSIFSVSLYMIAKGMMLGNIRNQVCAWTISLLAVLVVLGFQIHDSYQYMFEQCFYPEKVAHDSLDDAYNSILIKNLLSKAEMMGTINLSQDELHSYYKSDWYFDNVSVDGFYYRNKMQNIETRNITLEDIMPQHYQNNYRIAYWILKYGWLPSFVLLGSVIIGYGMLIRMLTYINSKMGKVLALSCILALLLQVVLYSLGNFGYQFASFCSFPFISEGICGITINMTLVGLACSAYRYDLVVKEEIKVSPQPL